MIQRRNSRLRTPAPIPQAAPMLQKSIQMAGDEPQLALPMTFACGHTHYIAGVTHEAITSIAAGQREGLCIVCKQIKFGSQSNEWVFTWGTAFGLPGHVPVICPSGHAGVVFNIAPPPAAPDGHTPRANPL